MMNRSITDRYALPTVNPPRIFFYCFIIIFLLFYCNFFLENSGGTHSHQNVPRWFSDCDSIEHQNGCCAGIEFCVPGHFRLLTYILVTFFTLCYIVVMTRKCRMDSKKHHFWDLCCSTCFRRRGFRQMSLLHVCNKSRIQLIN